ncbi:MAG TPA: hypothetical protein VF723_11220 [Pyrinomonadaceae bacterium]|jgi:hypothetical protein
MNKLSRLSLVLLLLISVIAAQGQSTSVKSRKPEPRQKGQIASQAPAKWYTFTSPDEDFTLTFPVKPTRLPDVQTESAIVRHYGAETTDIYFDLNFQDLLVPADDPAYSTFGPRYEITRAQNVSRDGSRVIGHRRVAANVSDMERWQAPGQRDRYIHLLTRSIVHNGRLYLLGCSARPFNQEVDKKVCRRFFNSFRIIGVPQ